MAIDSKAKRASVAGTVVPFMLGVVPDNTKPAKWRQSVAWSYYGIAADSSAFQAALARYANIVLQPGVTG